VSHTLVQDWPVTRTGPQLDRVQRHGMRGGAATVAALGLLIVGFAVGSRVGGQSVPATPVAPPPTQTVTAPPTAEPIPRPVVHLEAVDPAVQQAYYGAGAGFAICAVDPQPSCYSHDTIVPLTDRLPVTFTDKIWAQLQPFRITGHGFVAVEALDAASVKATLLDITSGPNETLGYDLVVVNPAGQGIYYIDVGYQSTGRYLVIVRALVGPSSQALGNAGAAYKWQTNVLALDAVVSGQ
jgi:hypothetical protein